MNTRPCYQPILDLPGLEALKAVVRQWDAVAQNLPRHPAGLPLVLPNLLLKTMPGAGKTHFLQLLCEYLDTAGLLDFYGDVRFLEFYLEHCGAGEPLTELTRLIGEVRDAAGFRRDFRGVLAIDITPWRKSFGEAHFIRVLEYLSSIDERVCLVFVAENLDEDELARAEQVLLGYFRLKSVPFGYPEASELTAFCVTQLEKYHLRLDDSARALLEQTVTALMAYDYFDGYKTLIRLCQDIAFHLVSLPDLGGAAITAAHLADFSSDSPFVTGLMRISRRRAIGFGGEV